MNSEVTHFCGQYARLFQFLKPHHVRSLSEAMEHSFFLEVRKTAKQANTLPCYTKETAGLAGSVQSSIMFAMHGKRVAGHRYSASALDTLIHFSTY